MKYYDQRFIGLLIPLMIIITVIDLQMGGTYIFFELGSSIGRFGISGLFAWIFYAIIIRSCKITKKRLQQNIFTLAFVISLIIQRGLEYMGSVR